MTTLSPPPNWYPDPSGRHESRYWDGFTWTPHVADRGQPGLDPLVRADPIPAVAPAAGSRHADPIGPGTEALRSMATVRPEPTADGSTTDPRVAKVAPIRRRGAVFDVTAVLAVIVVIVFGGYVLWQGWDASSSPGRTDPRGVVVSKGTGYRFEVPPSWVGREVPDPMAAQDVEAAFTVIDSAQVSVLVGPDPLSRAQIPHKAQLADYLTSQLGAAAPAGVTVTTSTEVLPDVEPLIGKAQIDAISSEGATLSSLVFVVIGRERSVTLALTGPPDAVARHERELRTAARSVVGVSRRATPQ